MRKLCVVTTLALVALTGLARANTVTGSIWENDPTGAGDATPANVPGTTPDVTFTAPSNPLSLCGGGGSLTPCGAYTIGGFIGSGGGTILTGASHAGDVLNNTLFNFVGTVSVTTGETFTAGHDDGLTLIIGGVTVINDPGPTSFTTTTETYHGPTGNESFQLVYGECCGAPADLYINLPLNGVPGPVAGAGLPGLVFGFGGLLAAWRFRRKQAAA